MGWRRGCLSRPLFTGTSAVDVGCGRGCCWCWCCVLTHGVVGPTRPPYWLGSLRKNINDSLWVLLIVPTSSFARTAVLSGIRCLGNREFYLLYRLVCSPERLSCLPYAPLAAEGVLCVYLYGRKKVGARDKEELMGLHA